MTRLLREASPARPEREATGTRAAIERGSGSRGREGGARKLGIPAGGTARSVLVGQRGVWRNAASGRPHPRGHHPLP